jgi:hypothetical protein
VKDVCYEVRRAEACHGVDEWPGTHHALLSARERKITSVKGGGGDDDHPFIVLTETKFSLRCIPVWVRYSPHRTRVEKKHMR